MKPIKQTILGDMGNCLQTCVASLFELDLDQVPHFISYGDDFWTVLRDWLRDRNIEVIWSPNFIPIGTWHIASVVSPYTPGESHAVICDFDSHVVHDPHPDAKPDQDYEFLGYYWFAVIDPAKMV